MRHRLGCHAGGDKIIELSLYRKYEKKHEYVLLSSFWGETILVYTIIGLIIAGWLKSSFLLPSLVCVMTPVFILSLVLLSLSTQKVIFYDEKIVIVRKMNIRRVVNIGDISNLSIPQLTDLFYYISKSFRLYYGLYFKLKNGKNVMLAGCLHITTLVEFLNKFLELYEDRLPPECVKTIKEFIKEKGSLVRKEGG